MNSKTGLTGHGTIWLYDAEGNLKTSQEFKNLITTNGDLYYATRAAAGVNSNGLAQPTLVTGMKLGTGTTAASKSGAGSALVAYKPGSNLALTATYPTVAAIGSDIGYRVTYFASWGPGVATDTALTEAVIVNNSASDSTSLAAATISRVVFTAINKQAGDTLQISWAHDFLGGV